MSPSNIDFRRYKVLSFDCYGTLIDWERGLITAAQSFLDASPAVDDAAFIHAFGKIEREVQAEFPRMLYPDVLALVLRRIATRYGLHVTEEQSKAFGATVGTWPPFSETVEALEALSKNFKLIVLSNVDRDSFSQTSKQLKVKFDRVITAEDVGSYKPSFHNFQELLAALPDFGASKSQLLHVAESVHHDLVPAAQMHIDAAWIDRARSSSAPRASGEPPPSNARFIARYGSLRDFATAATGTPSTMECA